MRNRRGPATVTGQSHPQGAIVAAGGDDDTGSQETCPRLDLIHFADEGISRETLEPDCVVGLIC